MIINKRYHPIGLFDSGIGGLTIAKSLKELLPNESIIYFGDTKHFPYGEKSSEDIISYVKNIFEILLKYDCKLIIIACNTAYAASHKYLEKNIDKNIPIINVIDPMIEFIQNNHAENKVGLIATNRTIHSDIYNNKVLKCKNLNKLSSLATPLLAPMIEKGQNDDNKLNKTITHYLSNNSLKDIETLILGCTHYYLIKDKIENFYNKKIKILDASKMAAEKAESVLEKHNILSDKKSTNKDIFMVSNLTENFKNVVHKLFGENIVLKSCIYD
ncbi:MAG: glutamate racemase [Bacteroidetes bacterium]|nr:glutamate racemase [Bacteroidota bacterium]